MCLLEVLASVIQRKRLRSCDDLKKDCEKASIRRNMSLDSELVGVNPSEGIAL